MQLLVLQSGSDMQCLLYQDYQMEYPTSRYSGHPTSRCRQTGQARLGSNKELFSAVVRIFWVKPPRARWPLSQPDWSPCGCVLPSPTSACLLSFMPLLIPWLALIATTLPPLTLTPSIPYYSLTSKAEYTLPPATHGYACLPFFFLTRRV
ncbi:hypothetical protein BJX62DRAFT_220799 [Aspergillus germanicus]